MISRLNKFGAGASRRTKSALRQIIPLFCYLVLPFLLPATFGKLFHSTLAFIIGFILALCIIAGLGLYMNRSMLRATIHYIETLMFGKPLDAENWEPGELRKVRPFSWRKKNDEGT